MKKILIILFISLFLMFISGCNDEYSFKMIEPIESVTNVFEDAGIIIEFIEITNEISVNIINNTDHLVKIIWDNCVYTGFDGKTSSVIHYGIKYSDKEKSMHPSIISPKTKLREGIIPISKIDWILNTWEATDIIDPFGPPADGKTFSLRLCMKKDEQEVFYSFKFLVSKMVNENENAGKIKFNPILPHPWQE